MKKILTAAYLAAALLLLGACARQNNHISLDELNCVEVGLEEETSFCWAYTYVEYGNYYENEVYLLKGGRRQEVAGMGDGSEINTMLVSPSKMYAALEENGGEGHPYLAIITLAELRQGRKPRYMAGYDPYPGSLWEMRWQGDKLLFNTDKELSVDNVASGEIRTYSITYSLDAATGELAQVGEPVLLE
ncbi:MAG: hypothetical protein C0615_06570 [Desulfuromonas sp.]|nr:MAG: hypothetical protein C0615_06570 [Desulfuromonas sp.]